MARKLFCAFLLSQFISVSIARLKNPCFEFETCDSCISHRLCRWVVNIDNYLLSPDTQRGRKQCVLRDTRTQFNPADVYDPISTSKDSGEIQTAAINIKPTSVTLDLSAGKQTEFKVSVQPLRMEKLKIYFLVHLSSDFSRVLSTMSPLIEEIAIGLRENYPNVMFGIGKFADIPVYPFVDIPKTATSTYEASEYVFKNFQSMTHDILEVTYHFTGGRNNILDEPESVLDAMAQVSECSKIIGWGTDTEVIRLMIVITDVTSKRAGHGDIIAHYIPNECKCKTNSDGILKTLDTDYIHPHLLEESLSKNNIRVLILTRQSLFQHYKLLTESFKHQVVGIEDFDSFSTKPLMTIIENSIKQERHIKFNLDFLKSQFQVSHSIKCSSSKPEVPNTLECENVPLKTSAILNIKIKHSECLAQPISTYLKVNGFYKIAIKVGFSCTCPCVKATLPLTKQPKCNNHGQLVCGKCVCDSGWEGDTCMCQTDQTRISSGTPECINDYECGEFGKCLCNKCKCPNSPEQLYGPGCACSDIICPSTQKGLCNSLGTCECGTCKCKPGISGDDCTQMSCTHQVKLNGCRRRATDKVCSERGQCDCGSCVCDHGFRGPFCERYIVPTARCSDVRECMTRAFLSQNLDACQKRVNHVNTLEQPKSLFKQICQILIKSCLREFMIHIDDAGTTIEQITVKNLTPSDCVVGANFVKSLVLLVGGTALATIIFVLSIYGLYYNIYKKRREEQRVEERPQRHWVLRSDENQVATSQQSQTPTN